MGGPCVLTDTETGRGRGVAPACTDNFQIKPFELDGVAWVSVEQCVQALKYTNQEKQEAMQQMVPKAKEDSREYGIRIFQAGRERLPFRTDWDIVKAEVMYRALRAKFARHLDAQAELLATGTLTIRHPDGGFWGEWIGLAFMRLREELRPSTERIPGLLEELVQRFQDRLGSSKPSLPGLEALPQVREDNSAPTQESILASFRRFDENGDGLIGTDELARVLKVLDPKVWRKQRIARLMKVIDKDGDGTISYDEFVEWIGGSATAVERVAILSDPLRPQTADSLKRSSLVSGTRGSRKSISRPNTSDARSSGRRSRSPSLTPKVGQRASVSRTDSAAVPRRSRISGPAFAPPPGFCAWGISHSKSEEIREQPKWYTGRGSRNNSPARSPCPSEGGDGSARDAAPVPPTDAPIRPRFHTEPVRSAAAEDELA
eukprot:TRINITY_DN23223_c0_g1_i1.p1 TRINITY_DN23223_c0_g1~~TRINITY_DN23223_c0_g1_i1.p1  ORF type:complete len:432 (+),score=66.27 TRINITY_DN23223_c0_g1_i1:273-1568(+)